jgi:hypothetical protein
MAKQLELEDVKIPVRMKLLALWSSVMFFYIYGDYFELYQPGKLQGMLGGKMAFGPISQGILLGMSALLAVPALMVFLSLVLPSRVNRWMNVFFGVLYTVVMVLAMQGAWHFYVFYGLVEITLTSTIVWLAWTWPRQLHP